MSVREYLEGWFATHPGRSVHIGEDGARYWGGPAECRACGHRWQAVAELEAGRGQPVALLECPRCGRPAGGPG